METTPTGIPVTRCGDCGYRHPVTRRHCIVCGMGTAFIRDDGGCVRH